MKTQEGLIIEKGTKIYYTGDMANQEGWFIVERIEPSEWYGETANLREEEGEKRVIKALTVLLFDKGSGQRFKPMPQWRKERADSLRKMREFARKYAKK